MGARTRARARRGGGRASASTVECTGEVEPGDVGRVARARDGASPGRRGVGQGGADVLERPRRDREWRGDRGPAREGSRGLARGLAGGERACEREEQRELVAESLVRAQKNGRRVRTAAPAPHRDRPAKCSRPGLANLRAPWCPASSCSTASCARSSTSKSRRRAREKQGERSRQFRRIVQTRSTAFARKIDLLLSRSESYSRLQIVAKASFEKRECDLAASEDEDDVDLDRRLLAPSPSGPPLRPAAHHV